MGSIKRIGLLGGSFDPIHWAHLLLAEIARESAGLERVVFIPARQNPLKEHPTKASGEDRLAMVQLAVADNPAFTASDLELNRSGPSYTVDTLEAFAATYPPPDHELFFIIGKDNLNDLHRWHRPDRILQLCRLLVFERPHIPLTPEAEAYLERVTFLEGPQLDISATQIRRRVQAGQTIRYFVPEPVRAYILTHHLYR
ncbi:MAG: nicotinate-nucleotide adenylyltransferase [Calditrichaeota bacterium]|nr:MAG: nicotinate-nucleotide adenylyltransferase [Calditrichota bacterium]